MMHLFACFTALLMLTVAPAAAETLQADDQPQESGHTSVIDFDSQIIPLLTRFGCNSGACHGSAAGRGGLRLSLYGSRPVADHEALSLEWEGRRVHLGDPEQSLMFQKAVGLMDHGGDVRFPERSDAARLLLKWLEQGAARRPGPQLVRLNVTVTADSIATAGPEAANTASGDGIQAVFRLRAEAKFDPVRGGVGERSGASKGSGASEASSLFRSDELPVDDFCIRDVTPWTVYSAQDPAAVRIYKDGRVDVLRPGRHVLVARFMDRVIPVELMVPYAESYEQRPLVAAGVPEHWIDRLIAERLELLQIPLSPLCDDDSFLRRATLTLTGRLPTRQQFLAFRGESGMDRRLELIDRLLHSDAFTDYWTFRLATLFRFGTAGSEQSARTGHQWLRQQVKQGIRLDRLIEQLVLAEGDPETDGPAVFYLTGGDPRVLGEFFSESLLGIRLRCANCHDHPLDQWTQDDYHGLAAVFAGLERRGTVRYTGAGTLIHPATGQAAIPRIPGGLFLQAGPGQNADALLRQSPDHRNSDLRHQLFAWMVQEQQPLLARSMVNRVWKHLMGRGLIEPADDVRSTNPPTHPELLESLTAEFVKSEWNLRHLIHTICSSRTWQRSHRPVSGDVADEMFYSHSIVRPMEPAVFLDAICDVTGIAETFGEGAESLQESRRAISQPSLRKAVAVLDELGACGDSGRCEQAASGSSLPLALQLVNGRLVNEKLSAADGLVAQLLGENQSDDELVARIYQLSLSRDPRPPERLLWHQHLSEARAADQDQERQRDDVGRSVVEDMVWTLLTSREFREIR